VIQIQPRPGERRRKLMSVPPELAAAVKEFRFRMRLENDTEALSPADQEGPGSLRARGARDEAAAVIAWLNSTRCVEIRR
jgi:hypothetical protein